jgi:hypothetical protein
MRLDLLADLPFPEVDTKTSSAIAHRVAAIVEGRRRSREAEVEAIHLVESEIIPAWLS